MKSRKRVTARVLHELMEREYARTAGDLCRKCRIPRPGYFAGAKAGPNWRVPQSGECPSTCHTIMADIVAKFATTHDLRETGEKKT